MEELKNIDGSQLPLKTSKKEYLFWFVMLAFFAAVVYSTLVAMDVRDKAEDDKISSAANHHQLIDSLTKYNILQSIVRNENKNYYITIAKKMSERADIKVLQQQINKSYEKIYANIKTGNDSVQLVIHDSLIAKHRRLRFERR